MLIFSPFPSQVRDEAMKAGCPPTRESVWSYFVKKSANNLHIVLCMSPIGEVLKTRCRNFPGLVNNTSIDWFTAWPKQALQAVASQFLAEVRGSITKRIREFFAHVCIRFVRGHGSQLRQSSKKFMYIHVYMVNCTHICTCNQPHTILSPLFCNYCIHMCMYIVP